MSGIQVTVADPTEQGQLEPRYDEEAGILAAESSACTEWRHGIDVDGRLVFDLDANRQLVNFDLHVPRNRWQREHHRWSLPHRRGTLVFAPETLGIKSFHLPLRVSADHGARIVRIEIGPTSPNEVVALSDHCVALLSNGYLAGLGVSLAG